MTWRVAESLLVLRDQVDEMWPTRSKGSDGTIGDAAHAERRSDHNPDANGVVRALDLTHDVASGANMHLLAEQLRKGRDPRVKYVIWNARMFSSYPKDPWDRWEWRPYSGPNMHRGHIHVSVVADSRADDRSEWTIGETNMHTLKDHAVYHGQGPQPWGDAPWEDYVTGRYTSMPHSRTWEVRREDLAWFRGMFLEEVKAVVDSKIREARQEILAEVDRRIAAAVIQGPSAEYIRQQAVSEITKRLTNG